MRIWDFRAVQDAHLLTFYSVVDLEVDSIIVQTLSIPIGGNTMTPKNFAHAPGQRARPTIKIAAANLNVNAMVDKDRPAANPAPTSPKRE